MEKEDALKVLFGSIIDEMKESSNKKLDEITKSVEDKAEALEKKMGESLKRLNDILDNKPITVNFGTVEQPQNEVTHKAFDKILKILQSAKRKDKHIMLVGGAGGGKTHLAGQIAKALGIQFYPMSVGLQTTKSDLLGFINATGGYITSPVREAYEKGGLLLLDEFDSTHAGVVTILNSLLANGHATFPDKIIEKNEKFVCMCACNTYGRGGNIDYIGRNKLDGATLDRFIIVDVDYDNGLERNLANNDTWVDVIEKVRENIRNQGIKMIVSPRASMDGADLLEAGFTPQEVMEMVIYKGCDEDVKTKISKGIALSKVRKRPNRNDTSVPAVVDGLPLEKLPECIIDFDLCQYCLKGVENRIELESESTNWSSKFSVHIGKGYYSEITESSIFIDNNEERGYLNKNIISDNDITHFIHSMNKHASESPEKFVFRLRYKGEERVIRMGE